MFGQLFAAGIGTAAALFCRRAVLALSFFLLLACSAHKTNVSLCPGPDSAEPCTYNPEHGYRFKPDTAEIEDRDTLVVLTFSGGGIRASALAFGTLQALKDVPGVHEKSLLDEVDIISSVSGGSVTAAWYGLKGQEGLGTDENTNSFLRFLHEGGGGKLTWSLRLLNPVSVARLTFTDHQRSDALADLFAARLFRDKDGRDFTYEDLEKEYRDRKGKLPFVMLNATDLGHETGFPFTQNRFDLICSDLSRFHIADAVAASANFPLAFSAMGIQNFSPDCKQKGVHQTAAWTERGPSHWIEGYRFCDARDNDPSGAGVLPPRSNGLLQLRAARQADNYINPPENDAVLHLLDGGLTDNLGILSTLAIEDRANRGPGLFERLSPSAHNNDPHDASGRYDKAKRYDKIKNVLYIVVNARSRTPAGIDGTIYPPDELSTLVRLIDTSLDATILTNQNYLTSELHSIVAPAPKEATKLPSCTGIYDKQSREIVVKIVAIDFEVIPISRCREKFWTLGTTWSLDRKSIDDLIDLPGVLLSKSLEFKEFYRNAGKNEPSFAGVPQDFTNVCRDISP